MGLGFSHCDAGWAYSGFMRFRIKLAKEIGIELDKMKGFVGFDGKHGKTWDGLTDPIIPLLNHSDCDGDLSPEECKAIAPRLRELVAKWPDTDFDKLSAIELAEGMEVAAAADEPLEFI